MKLLLLPGMDGGGDLFASFLELLPNWLSPVIVRYPSDRPLAYPQLFDLILEACPKSSDFVALAESFSGPLAILLGAKAPTGLKGIILCASFDRCPLSAPWRWLLAMTPTMAIRWTPDWALRWALLGPYADDRLARQLAEAVARVQPATLAARARAIARVDVSEELRNCRVPICYLAADGDRLIGNRSVASILGVRPDVVVIRLPGSHLLLQTSPEASLRAVLGFIQQATGVTRSEG